MDFNEYLISKKIDREAFAKAEPEVLVHWQREFEQMHPNSFTVQKLNLINPVRRKYPLKQVVAESQVSTTPTSPAAPALKPGKPMMKPKPKIN